MRNTRCRMRMGPARAAAPAAPKFWNVASVDDDEGEITLYGDVVSQQPTDFWTGEPEPGLYITPEGFMEDLAAVRDKARITVKLNSCGGDLYTGIAIHNALRALPGEVGVIVEGIAASAASVIMCAGDTVTVYPGSMVMIHGVSAEMWGYYGIADMKRIIKGMDASERAVAAIYSEKTGIAEGTLRDMMDRETWMTGAEALEKGFADALAEGDVTASLSADHKTLYVCGIGHDVEGLRHVPDGIPTAAAAVPAAATPARPTADREPAARAATKGERAMTLEELMAQEPDLVAQIQRDAASAQAQAQAAEQASAVAAAVAAERQRLADIDGIAAAIPDQSLVQAAKYGEKPVTAQELCYEAMKQSAKDGQAFLASYRADGQASGTGSIPAAPAAGPDDDSADIQAVLNAYKTIKGGAD